MINENLINLMNEIDSISSKKRIFFRTNRIEIDSLDIPYFGVFNEVIDFRKERLQDATLLDHREWSWF
jgi:hypothetical protein